MKADEMRKEYNFSRAKRGVLAGKVEKKMTASSSETKSSSSTLAVCIKTFDSNSLVARKIYNVTFLADDLVRVIDESGEAEVYPAEFFLPLVLPAEVTSVLEQIAA